MTDKARPLLEEFIADGAPHWEIMAEAQKQMEEFELKVVHMEQVSGKEDVDWAAQAKQWGEDSQICQAHVEGVKSIIKRGQKALTAV